MYGCFSAYATSPFPVRLFRVMQKPIYFFKEKPSPEPYAYAELTPAWLSACPCHVSVHIYAQKCCNLQLKSLAIYLFGVMLYNLKHLIRLRRQCPSKMIWCWAVLGLAGPRRTETSVCLREPCFCLREPYAKIAIFFVGRVWGRWQGAVSLLVTSMHVLLAMHLHLAVHLHLALHLHLAMCFLLALHLHLHIQCKSIGNPWKLQYLQYRIKKMWTFESMHVDISLTPPTKIWNQLDDQYSVYFLLTPPTKSKMQNYLRHPSKN